MIRVMIVDDEFLVRVGLKSTIDWQENGYEIVAEAENGLQALEIIRRQPVDIILLDIEMPVMNGIELLTKMKEEGIESKVIILSSHSDFEYARQALKMGCLDYILKLSVEPDQLLVLMNSVKEDIEEVTVTSPDYNEAYKSLSLMLMNDGPGIQEQCEVTLTRTPDRAMLLLYVAVDEEEDSRKRIAAGTAVTNILSGIINDYTSGDCFRLTEEVFVCTVSGSGDRSVIDLCGNIQNAMKNYLDVTVSIGIGLEAEGYGDVAKAFKSAQSACERRFFLGPETLAVFKEASSCGNSILLTNEMENRLKQALIRLDQTEASKVLTEYTQVVSETLKECWVQPGDIFRDIEGILYITSKELKLYGCSLTDIAESEGLDQIRASRFFSDLMEWLSNFVAGVLGRLKEIGRDEGHQEIREAIGYMENHLGESLSLTSIADRYGMSSSYFGTLFKKENGRSFTSCLTELRMKKAEEYLRSTDMTVSEIAEVTGYENIYYFSNVFKKALGLSPMAYRKKLKEDCHENL